MDLGPWTPFVRDSGWQYTGCWFQVLPHVEMCGIFRPLTFQSELQIILQQSRLASLQEAIPAPPSTLRQSSSGLRPSVCASFPTPCRCYRVCWPPAPVLCSERPWSAKELCTILWQLSAHPPFSARAPFGGSLGLDAGEGRSALPFSHRDPTAWPLPWFLSPNLAAEEAQIPQLDPKTSSGTLCLKICFLFLLLRRGY